MNLIKAKQFMNESKTCVIATVDSLSNPQAATVGFSIEDEFKIMFATNEDTRKAANLVSDKRIAVVVGFDNEKTVQLEGLAHKVNQAIYKDRINLHFEKVPGAKKYQNEHGQSYYLVTPKWLRFTDYSKNPSIFETRSFV